MKKCATKDDRCEPVESVCCPQRNNCMTYLILFILLAIIIGGTQIL